MRKWIKREEPMLLTSKLKPVTDAKEVAMEAPERASSPRWPTNISEIICKLHIRRLTDIKGPASFNCFFTSPKISSLFALFLDPGRASWDTWINGDSKHGLWSSLSIEVGVTTFLAAWHTNHKCRAHKVEDIIIEVPFSWKYL